MITKPDSPSVERKIAAIRLVVLFSILPLLWWDVVSPESEMVLTGLTVLIAAYILGAFFLLPRLRLSPRKDVFLVIDILFITALTYSTGGVNSPLLFLFYLPVLAAAVRTDLRHTFLSAVALSTIVVWMWNVAEGGLPSLGPTAFKVGIFTLSSLVAALFFGTLAQETRLSAARASLNQVLDAKLAEATEQLRRRLEDLEFFYNLSRRLSATTGVADVLGVVADAAQQQLNAPCSAVFLYEHLGGSLSLAHARGSNAVEASPIMYACGDRLAAGVTKAVFVETPEGVTWTRGVCAPIMAGGRLIGAVCAGGTEAWSYDESKFDGLTHIADQAGVALERAYLLEDLQRLALADPAARLYEPEQLDRMLREEMTRSNQLGASFALLQVQLKGISADAVRVGDPTTDLLLKRVAAIILESARRVDVVARGGGTFFILLPMTNLDSARKFADKLRARLEDDATAARITSAPRRLEALTTVTVFPQDAAALEKFRAATQTGGDS